MLKKLPEKQVEEVTETREEAGIRLALKRMPQLKRVFKKVAKLGAYRIRENYVKQMCDSIDEWAKETKILLQNHSTDGSSEFRFK